MATSTPIFWPAVRPVVTEEAGTRGGGHSGIDLAARRGDPVLAPFDGVAVYVGGDGASGRLWLGSGWLYPNGEGRTVDIRRDDGLISRVGHLEGYAIRQGDRVTAGQVVGYAGDSGYSTGVHIHWELRWDRAWSGGRWVNPRTVSPQLFGSASVVPSTPILEEDDMSTIYLRASANSSPLRPGDLSTSRIWAGDGRKIAGAEYSGVWAVDEATGTPRRLFTGEWAGIQAAYTAAGRKVPLASVHGNVIEQLYLAPRTVPKR